MWGWRWVCMLSLLVGACGGDELLPPDEGTTPEVRRTDQPATDELGNSNASRPRNDVLIVVNDNSKASIDIGTHYATERKIPERYIAHVSARPNYFVTLDEFRSLRDQLIRFMQENTLDDPDLEPVVCEDGEPPYYCEASIAQLRDHSTIRYIVTTKGVPTRFVFEGSPLPYNGPTSVDNYLRHWLIAYYDVDVGFRPLERARAFADGRGMRVVDPAVDGELIVGRLDGLTTDAAKTLVDRAIAAEENGIFGKFYGSQYVSYGNARWFDYAKNRLVYGTSATEWHYPMGLFGQLETDGLLSGVHYAMEPGCLSHLGYDNKIPEGKSPQECVVKMTTGADPPPATASSRQPWVDDALVYQGSLDGQPTTGSFDRFTYWRKDATCSEPLCEDTADPDACRAASTDALRELNTDCMGVADGFIGYNLQSYPVSFFSVWPTAWFQSTNTTDWGHRGGGDVNNLALPEVRTDVGFDDDFSLWFRNTDAVSQPKCYADATALQSGSLTDCAADKRRVVINNLVTFAPQTLDLSIPRSYTVRFWYRVEDGKATSNLRVRLWAHEVGAGPDEVALGLQVLANAIVVGSTDDVVGNVNGWVEASATFLASPAAFGCAEPCTDSVDLDGLELRIETVQDMVATLAIDAVSVERDDDGVVSDVAIVNPSFAEGHSEVSAGDHAANFLSRLNGTAFWGSLSHHQSGGHSFENHTGETLLYFLRGLPLGDAVWFAESFNSGVFYGDPLYSPIAVRLEYQNPYDFVGGKVRLGGSAVNGKHGRAVDTSYAISYCPGSDFFACDTGGTWMDTGVSGPGGRRDMTFGTWDTAGLDPGSYVLRLAVTSTNEDRGKSQTFFDFYPVTVYSTTSDGDGDGLTDQAEIEEYGSNPTATDSDGDGLDDGDEVGVHGTNPAAADTDGDGMPDDFEIAYPSLDPNKADPDLDLDLDGLGALGEFEAGTSPADPDSDDDGLLDGQEVNLYGTDPTSADSDDDGISDAEELGQGTDPLVYADADGDAMSDHWELAHGLDVGSNDARADLDADGVDNIVELLRGTLPESAVSTPSISTLYVDGSSATGIEDGSSTNPYLTVGAALAVASAGDEIRIAPGTYAIGFLPMQTAVQLRATGPGVTLAGVYVWVTASWGDLEGIELDLSYQLRILRTRNMRIRDVVVHAAQGTFIGGASDIDVDNAVFTGSNTSTCVSVTSSTLTANHVTIAGCAIGLTSSSATLSVANSVFANTDDLDGVTSSTGFRFNLIGTGDFAWIDGNLPGSATFVDAGAGDYRLASISPGIDCADPAAAYDNEPAPSGSRANMGAFGNTASATSATDTDGDGLPDGWESIAGTSVGVADAGADPDGDGADNLAEFQAGTNPLAP